MSQRVILRGMPPEHTVEIDGVEYPGRKFKVAVDPNIALLYVEEEGGEPPTERPSPGFQNTEAGDVILFDDEFHRYVCAILAHRIEREPVPCSHTRTQELKSEQTGQVHRVCIDCGAWVCSCCKDRPSVLIGGGGR